MFWEEEEDQNFANFTRHILQKFDCLHIWSEIYIRLTRWSLTFKSEQISLKPFIKVVFS